MKSKWLLLPLSAALALSGCTSSTGTEDTQTPVETNSVVTQESTSIQTAPETVISPGTLDSIANKNMTDVNCTKDSNGSWSFHGVLNNGSDKARTFTVAIAVTVGSSTKGHAMITQEVPAKSTFDVIAKDFATAADEGAVCEPVTSVEG